MKLLLCIALVVFSMISMAHCQGITFDESKLCVSYQIGISWVDAPVGAKIRFQNPITQLASFTVPSTSGTKWLYFLPTQDESYDTYMLASDNSLLYGITYSGPAPCTNLETYGLETEKQAVVIMNYVRTLNSLPKLYWHSSLQSYSEHLANNNLTTCNGQDVISYGYTYSSLSCNIVSRTTSDPGSLVQDMVDANREAVTSSAYNEVGFGYNGPYKNWRYVMAKRSPICANGYVEATEKCDPGSRTENGCTNCQVNSGYTCTNGVFTMGSTCSLAPQAPTTPVAQAPTATPTASPVANAPTAAPTTTPVASQPPSATPTVSPPVKPPTTTPVANAPSAAPTASPAAGNTPSGGVTPTAATPSATPTSTPSGGVTPSSSPVDQGTPTNSQTPDGSSVPSSIPSDVNTPSDSNSPNAEPASSGQTPVAGPVKNAPFEGTPKSQNIISSASNVRNVVLTVVAMIAAVFIL